MSEMVETSGHLLKVGDLVRMNLDTIKDEDMDGIQITETGVDYWRYMCQHPEEVYTVVGYDFTCEDEVSYLLSGPMTGNNWYANELLLVPRPMTRFEWLKSMTFEEMTASLPTVICALCEDGFPSKEYIEEWLNGNPNEDDDNPNKDE